MAIFDSKYLISVYEELRSCVSGGCYAFSQPPGLDLFLKKGFLKWSQVQKETGVRAMPAEGPAAVKEPGSLSCGIEQEITLILANMILERTGSVSA
ncbi:MAG: hypothetical protein H8E04_00440 [Actinobacteria bacterium]|nr:hypothetical protein [Actinomycetota bacterium]